MKPVLFANILEVWLSNPPALWTLIMSVINSHKLLKLNLSSLIVLKTTKKLTSLASGEKDFG